MPDVWGMVIWCGQTLLPQSLRLWSPLPPLLVQLRSVPQAFWRWSQNVCTDRWWAAHRQAPLHPCQDSTVPFRRGRSLRPGWNTEGGFKGSQEWSLMKNQRTGRTGVGFVAVRWELVLLGEKDVPEALRRWSRLLFLIISKSSNIQRWIWSVCWAVRMQTCTTLKLNGKATFYRWSEEEPRCPEWSVKITCPEIWTAVSVVVPLGPDVGETQVLSCHMCFSLALLSPNHLKSYQNVQKRKVPRQSFSGSWGQWKPLLTSLNTRKDCLSLEKKQCLKRFKVTWQWRK